MAHTSAFAKGRFVCFDGEGVTIDGTHEYCYLASFDGNSYVSIANWRNGLSTEQCLRFLLDNSRYEGIHVIYGGSYDANMILRTLPRDRLEELHAKGRTSWRGYGIDYTPRKYLGIQHPASGRKVRIWDVIGFFQGSFVKTLQLWLDVEDAVIAKGKANRNSFTSAQRDDIEYYCRQELARFYDLMARFWQAVQSITLTLSRWDGAGAGASALYKRYGMRDAIGSYDLQRKHYDKAQLAYAGGTFQLFRPGDFREPVYEYDINSAYPFYIAQLPPFQPLRTRVQKGRFSCGCENSVGPYDLVHYRYKGDKQAKIHPLYHRDERGQITKPFAVEGWVWGVEFLAALAWEATLEILHVYHWHDDGSRPFSWIHDEYQKRLYLQAIGTRAQHSLKLFLNSLYGKLAQQKGWKPTRPTKSIPWTHNLYMAGWVTASTRAMLQRVIVRTPTAIIACETDAVFATKRLDVPLGIELGQWKETVFPNGLSYLQSGMYFGDKEGGQAVERYRGIDQYDKQGRKILTRAKVLRAWENMQRGGKPVLRVACTRFRTMGTSLAGERLDTWRQWITEPRELSLVPGGKRVHIDPLCAIDHQRCKPPCRWGPGHNHVTWPVVPAGGDTVSKPYAVLWVTGPKKTKYYQQRAEQDEYDIWEE